MKILLINPHSSKFSWNQEPAPPLGLLYLASAIEKKTFGIQQNHDVLVLPLQLHKNIFGQNIYDVVKSTVSDFSPSVIGISTITSSTPNAINIAKYCREISPLSTIVMGGYQATVNPAMFFEKNIADFVIVGEGEQAFCALIAELEEKDTTGKTYIKGIVHKDISRKKIVRSQRVADVDVFPLPARHLVPMQEYLKLGNPYRSGGIISSRGCPWSCNYCYSSQLWEKATFRSPKSVVDEIEFLQKQYGINKFRFEDDTFTAHKKRAKEISLMIKERSLQIEWEARSRIDIQDRNLLETMKDAGLVRLQVGIETVSESSLLEYNRKMSFQDYENFFSLIRDVEIGVIATIIVGLPTETPEQMINTIEWVGNKMTTNDRFIRCMYTPFPGTTIPRANNTKILSRNLEKYTMDIPLVTSDFFNLEDLLTVKKKADEYMKSSGPHHAVNSKMPEEDSMTNIKI